VPGHAEKLAHLLQRLATSQWPSTETPTSLIPHSAGSGGLQNPIQTGFACLSKTAWLKLKKNQTVSLQVFIHRILEFEF
jgi:hypothetical protein